MGNEILPLHSEVQLEQDIVVLAHDIYANTNATHFSSLKDKDKELIKIKFDSIFSSLSASGEELVTSLTSILSERDFYKGLGDISKDGLATLKEFLDDISGLYQKIETDVQPYETRYAYSLAAVLINVGVLSRDITATSTSFKLDYATKVQDKIQDVISLNSQ